MTDNWGSSTAVGYMTAQKQTAWPAGVPSKEVNLIKSKQFVWRHICRRRHTRMGCIDVPTHTCAHKRKHVQKHSFQEITANKARTTAHSTHDKHVCTNDEISFIPVVGFLFLFDQEFKYWNLSRTELHSLQLQCEYIIYFK